MKNKIKILLVDDDSDILNAIKVILENQDYTVITATNKTEGINKAKTEKPDIAVLDVMMDGMQDGFDLSREIRTIPEFKNLPIILLTGIDSITGVNFKSAFGNTELLPIDAYIEKPVEPHILISEIKKLLKK